MGNSHKPDDAELVARALAADREAFGCLFDRSGRLVRAVVCGVIGERSMVDDLTQESFLRALRNLAKLRQPDRFGFWIAGIARQVARERKRSLRRDRHQFTAPETIDCSAAHDHIGAVQTTDEIDQMLRQLARLSERERLAIHAFFLEDRNADQAATLLGVSRSGLYGMLQRADKVGGARRL